MKSAHTNYRAKRFRDKACFVTGATLGIGRATALRMGQEGGEIAVIGRDAAEGLRSGGRAKSRG